VCHPIYRFETRLKPVNVLITLRLFTLNTQFVSSDDCYTHDESAVGTIAVIRRGINCWKSTSFHIPQNDIFNFFVSV
jgi:hypothetical protein